MDREVRVLTKVISDTVKIYGEVKVGDDVVIDEFTVVGYSAEPTGDVVTVIGDRCHIGSHVVICKGTRIGSETIIDDFCRIGESVSIGKKCRIVYGGPI